MCTSAAARYDASLRYRRDTRLPPGHPRPKPTSAWPPENIALLERYQAWLLSSGTSPAVVSQLYIPTAGNVLGFALKPHPELDLEHDFTVVMAYVKAKCRGSEWVEMTRCALDKFRRFLLQERGEPSDPPLRLINRAYYCAGLPDWLVALLERYEHLAACNWRPARSNEQRLRFWGGQTRVWRWLFGHYAITALTDIKRQYVLDYVDARLAAGYSPKSINGDLRCFHAFLLYLRDQGWETPRSLLRMPSLKEPDSLPKFLTDDEVRRLRDDLEARVAQPERAHHLRDALLDRAAFYLLWQGGLRLGEVEELKLEDLDLGRRKLMVRQGKGAKDRTVYLTDSVVKVLRAYLAERGLGTTSHVFLYRNRPLCKDLIRSRIKAAGRRAGVAVYPHRLRHTCATQLLNAGCRITSIQKFLGHTRLNSTMVYARVHDRTVAQDYYAAMEEVEKRLDLATSPDDSLPEPVGADEREQLLALAAQLAEPDLSAEVRLVLVARMRALLVRATPPLTASEENENGREPPDNRSPPPASFGSSVV
jgi:site-specific recombinase XerD